MSLEPISLGEFEQMVLLAVLCAGQDADAYGVNVHAELEERTKRRVARGAVYMTLDRLEKKGPAVVLSDRPHAGAGRTRQAVLSRHETGARGTARVPPGAAQSLGRRPHAGI